MMIHKIEPHKYYPEFRSQEPKPSDYLLLFDGERYICPPIQKSCDVTDTSMNADICEHPQVYLPTFEGGSWTLGNPSAYGTFFFGLRISLFH